MQRVAGSVGRVAGLLERSSVRVASVATNTGISGSGSGHGGGGGGSIRDAGGKFGEMEAAREGEYFYKLQKQQLANLKKEHDREIEYHEEQMKRHQEAIDRHKKRHAAIHSEEQNI